MKKFNYSNHFIDKNDKRDVLKALSSDVLTKGKYLKNFEEKLKKFTLAKYCTVVSNASCALITLLKSIPLKKNDKVWCSNNTYVSSINCALHLNLKIDLVDINLGDFNICVKSLQKKLLKTKKKDLPKLIIVTHLGGYSCDLKEIFILSKKYKFKIIEDASHALGAKYSKNRIGNCKYSIATIFSFHPSKVITSAEGGAIITNNREIFEKTKFIRENGHDFSKNKFKKIDSNYYDVKELGFNFRLNEMNCALGLSQLKKINKFIRYKSLLAKNYFNFLDKKKFIFPNYKENRVNSWHLFIVRINLKYLKKKKNIILKNLKKAGIYVKTHYPPLSSFTLIKKKIKTKEKYFNTYRYYKSAISIPIYYNLKFKDQKKIIKILNKL